MVNSGRSIYEVSSILGHSQLKTTQRYSHLSQETLLEAVDAAAEATGTDLGTTTNNINEGLTATLLRSVWRGWFAGVIPESQDVQWTY
jgi:hypothetical protein